MSQDTKAFIALALFFLFYTAVFLLFIFIDH